MVEARRGIYESRTQAQISFCSMLRLADIRTDRTHHSLIDTTLRSDALTYLKAQTKGSLLRNKGVDCRRQGGNQDKGTGHHGLSSDFRRQNRMMRMKMNHRSCRRAANTIDGSASSFDSAGRPLTFVHVGTTASNCLDVCRKGSCYDTTNNDQRSDW